MATLSKADKELVRERERMKEKEKEKELDKELEKELARERERLREVEREKEQIRERERMKEREKEREKLLREKQERSPKDPSPAHSSASSSASSSPSDSPASQAVSGTSPNKAKEEAPASSTPRNGEHKRKKARTEPPTKEGPASISPPSKDNNGTRKGPGLSPAEYKRRRAEWEKNYKEYCDLHRKLNENAQFFQNLGGQLKKASSTDKTKIVHQISTDYQKRISRVRQWKLRFSFLHAEIKKEKAALIALNTS